MITFEHIDILFQFGPVKVYSWGLMFVIAFLVALFLILRESKKQNIDEKHVYNLAFLILLGAIIGSRLFYIIENITYFLQNPLQIPLFWQGGLVSYGSLLAVLFAYFYIKKQKMSVGKILDIMAPYIVLAIAILRIGCFLRGCCGGIATDLPWAINGKHPTQLYESILAIIIFFILKKFKKIKQQGKNTRFKLMLNKPGAMFLYFLGFYSFFRFFTDFLRIYTHYWLGLSLTQWIALGIFVFAKIIYARNYFSLKVSPTKLTRQNQ
jgi:phosphatidylglycerol:prolipoprotein diacylglycerol transferase